MNDCCKMKKSNLLVIALASTSTILLDQVSKHLILQSFQPGAVRPVVDGLFNLTLTFNRGAAFGLWSGLPPGWREVILALTILFALLVVGYFLTRSYYQNALSQIALSMILGGACGNIIDRVRLGAVVDFLDVYYGSYHWPAFNVADSAICIGVGMLLLFPAKTVPVAPSDETKNSSMARTTK